MDARKFLRVCAIEKRAQQRFEAELRKPVATCRGYRLRRLANLVTAAERKAWAMAQETVPSATGLDSKIRR